MNTNIRNWYKEHFPEDDMGDEIDPNVTFDGLREALDSQQDVYKFLGMMDSVIRERIFGGLAKKMNVPYNDIYNKWLAPYRN